ncbi:MAG: PH domain-containing protein [Planctomycetes bacterium]|nr:PH domain-containing protein [Planctomycetota bacterium]
MNEPNATHEFEIDREKVCKYLLVTTSLVIGVATLPMCGLGLVLAPLWYLTIGRWVAGRQAAALRYWLDGTTLRINEGFVFLRRKAIPLDRVTDIAMAQGPLLRHFGMWAMKVQTAGTGQQMPEGQLHGVVDPEAARDLILARRDEAAGHRPADSGA